MTKDLRELIQSVLAHFNPGLEQSQQCGVVTFSAAFDRSTESLKLVVNSSEVLWQEECCFFKMVE
jgi:hypothetical protein